MIFQIKTINGQKTIVPLTADTGTGAPVGSFIYMYKKSSPSGYLYCDGSTFDQTKYPALYQYLGSNVLPDYRECVAVGAEQNTTDTIATHDVYTEGQFKDDQLQDHRHFVYTYQGGIDGTAYIKGSAGSGTGGFTSYSDASTMTGRFGDTTHGKQKAVFIYIKATSGLSENAQDNVINTLNEQRSYSTEEHLTGKKWIDGKPTYEKVFVCTVTQQLTLNSWNNITGSIADGNVIANTMENIVSARVQINAAYSSVVYQNVWGLIDRGNKTINIAPIGLVFDLLAGDNVILEYTKTTD